MIFGIVRENCGCTCLKGSNISNNNIKLHGLDKSFKIEHFCIFSSNYNEYKGDICKDGIVNNIN